MKYVALIGYGNMGRTHLRNLTNLTDIITVRGVYDTDPTVLAQAKQEGLYTFSSLDEILNDSLTDLVIIAIPNNLHKDISIACLASGKHVICEKPVTLNARELIEIMQAAKIYNRIFTIDQNRRWDRDYRIIKKLYDSQSYGNPYYIETRVQGSYGLPDKWLSYKKYGGGMLADWGVHLIDQLMWMIDSPVTSVYTNMVYGSKFDVEDNVKVLMKFENGISAQVQVDTTCYCNLPRWHVQFHNATAVIQDFNDLGTIYTQGSAETEKNDHYYTGSGPTRTMVPSEKILKDNLDADVDFDFINGYYRNVVNTIDGKESLIVKPEQALRVMRVLDACFESEHAGCSIPCNI